MNIFNQHIELFVCKKVKLEAYGIFCTEIVLDQFKQVETKSAIISVVLLSDKSNSVDFFVYLMW